MRGLRSLAIGLIAVLGIPSSTLLVSAQSPAPAPPDRPEVRLCLIVSAAWPGSPIDPWAFRAALKAGTVSVLSVVRCKPGALPPPPPTPAPTPTPLPSPSPIPPTPAPGTTGAWETTTRVADHITGKTVVELWLDELPGPARAKHPVVLFFSCDGDMTNATIWWGIDLGPGSFRDIRLWIDDDGITGSEWYVLPSGREMAWIEPSTSGTDATSFVKALTSASHLMARVTTESGKQIVANFDLTGIDVAIGEIRRACHW